MGEAGGILVQGLPRLNSEKILSQKSKLNKREQSFSPLKALIPIKLNIPLNHTFIQCCY
jgi:hypothetical protein